MVHRGTSIGRVAGRALAALAFGLVVVLASGGDLAVVVDDIGTTAAAALAAVACLLASGPSRRCRGRPAPTGLVLGRPGRPSWSAGNAIWAFYELVPTRTPRSPPPPTSATSASCPWPSPAWPCSARPSPASGRQARAGRHPHHGRPRRRRLDRRPRAGRGRRPTGLEEGLSLGLSDRRPGDAGRHPVGDRRDPTGRPRPRPPARRPRPLRPRRRGLRLHDGDRGLRQRQPHRVGLVHRVPGHRPRRSSGAADRAAVDLDGGHTRWVAEVVTHLPVIAVGALVVGQQVTDGEITTARSP